MGVIMVRYICSQEKPFPKGTNMYIVSNPSTPLQHKVITKINELCAYAKANSQLKLPEDEYCHLEVRFDLDSIRVGGQAIYDRLKNLMTIEVHEKALEFYNDQYIDQTIVHEFCHIMQFTNYPRSKAHGREFKNLMRFFGVPELRCHEYDLRQFKPARKPRKPAMKFQYNCKCGYAHMVGKKKHTNMMSGINYRCTICKGRLVRA